MYKNITSKLQKKTTDNLCGISMHSELKKMIFRYKSRNEN